MSGGTPGEGTVRDRLVDALIARVRRYALTGDRDALLDPQTLLEIDALLGPNTGFDAVATHVTAELHWRRYEELPEPEGSRDLQEAIRLFGVVLDHASVYPELPLIPEPVQMILSRRRAT